MVIIFPHGGSSNLHRVKTCCYQNKQTNKASLKGAGKKKAETSKTATNTVSAHSVSGELAAPVTKLILTRLSQGRW